MNGKNILTNKLFWVISIILSMIVFGVVLSVNRIYRAETQILLIAKNEAMAVNLEQVIETTQQIPMTLLFADGLVKTNIELGNKINNLSNIDRKESWLSMIETERIGKSGIVEIQNFARDQKEAEILNQQVVRKVLNDLSGYYNSKTDLDVRIVDGSVVYQTVKIDEWRWILLSLIFGFLMGFLLILFFMLLNRKEEEKEKMEKKIVFPIQAKAEEKMPKVELEKNSTETQFPLQKTEVEKTEVVKSFGETEKRWTWKDFAEKDNSSDKEEREEVKDIFDFRAEKEAAMLQSAKEVLPKNPNIVLEKKAVAPNNLPIADEEFAFKFVVEDNKKQESIVDEQKAVEEIPENKNEAVVDTKREATQEEVKERLNKLLRGEML